MKSMKSRIFTFSMDHPKLVLIFMGLITLFFLLQIPKIHIDTDPENMLSADEPIRKFHHEMKETFNLNDMLVLGIKLSLIGLGDFWEDVDRCLWNQFTENQITRTDWPERIPPRGTGPLEPGWYDQYDHHLQIWMDETDAVERAVGSWAGWAMPHDARHPSLMQCCAGNAGTGADDILLVDHGG